MILSAIMCEEKEELKKLGSSAWFVSARWHSRVDVNKSRFIDLLCRKALSSATMTRDVKPADLDRSILPSSEEKVDAKRVGPPLANDDVNAEYAETPNDDEDESEDGEADSSSDEDEDEPLPEPSKNIKVSPQCQPAQQDT